MRAIKFFLFLSMMTVLIGCFNEYDEAYQKKKCEATPCLDSLCMYWSYELKRCGTETALQKEVERRNNEVRARIVEKKDSLYKEYLDMMNRRNSQYDSLMKEIDVFVKNQELFEKKIDILLNWVRKRSFCDKMKYNSSVADVNKVDSITTKKVLVDKHKPFANWMKKIFSDQCDLNINW